MKKKRNYKRHITLKGVCRLFVCMVAVILLAIVLLKRQIVPKIPENSNEAEGFRQMYLTEDIMGRWHKICGQAEEDPYYVLAVLMAASGFGEKKEEKTNEITQMLLDLSEALIEPTNPKQENGYNFEEFNPQAFTQMFKGR